MEPVQMMTEQVQTSKSLRNRKMVDICFKDITYSVYDQSTKESKHILNGLTGYCPGGHVTAIMGSSGAGKTTLLNVLACRIQSTQSARLTGELLANAQSYDYSSFANFASYVMQNDVLLETLTPREAFAFVANLKYADPELKAARVEDTIKAMKLERCANTYIGGVNLKGISGGERKRTSIGFELVANPSCILLDEPTSGLDSFTAFQIIYQLKILAEEQDRTVIFTIHQPSSDIFKLFDRIMLLVSGRFIYQGSKDQIINHFANFGFQCPSHSNPMDYFISIMHNDPLNVSNYPAYFYNYESKLQTAVIQQIENVKQSDIEKTRVQASLMFQITVIAERSFSNFMRDAMQARMRIIQAIFQGLLIGGVFWAVADNDGSVSSLFSVAGTLFFMCVNLTFSAVMQVILGFAVEREVYLREENSKLYTTTAYFIGTQFIEVPFCIICPIIQCLVSYWMCSLNAQSAEIPVIHIFISVCLSLCCNSMGLMAGCAFKDVKLAINIVPMILTPLLIFSGFFANSNTFYVWIGWIMYLSPVKYSFEALSYNEYKNNHYRVDPIETYNFDVGLWNAVGALIGYMVLYRILALIFLLRLKQRLQ